ncbi:nucleoside hydrolase-like domain-containing protein [Pelagicoccus mobilis]|uniref:Cellulose-binding Sde182 nucleoside hydrolase-like domain-containing protein n=1 Tax=Pelagicoccus mobilis TaxID=415221 RepID=A0A934RSS2_9BACT|nr:nucleoside hydrolase-like domain-containing protein [Pelagicoccus mobilis]MBK1876197.1 hypothetical protein [Pelagicoccus mobilis]
MFLNRLVLPLLSLALFCSYSAAKTPEKPRVWVVTDIQVGGHGDPDDDVTMGAFLLLADHYQIEGITVGSSDRYSGGTKIWCEETFYADYLREVDNLNAVFDGAYQTEIGFHMASTSGHVFSELHPETQFDEFLDLYPSIRDMIAAAEEGPLYVLNWGLLTELSLAVKYCLEQGKIDTLKNLRIISHWTQRHGRWNCDTDNDACNYIHDQAENHPEVIMYELGPSGQQGMAENICQTAGELDRELMLNSRIGRYLDTKWIGYGRQKGMPDFSDGATFLVLMGFGGGLDYHSTNGIVANQEEANALLCADRPKIFALLEERAIAAAGQRPQGKTIDFTGSPTQLQKAIDSAPAGSVISCDPTQQFTLQEPIRIDKAITLKGLNARLPDGLGSTQLIVVESEGVKLTDLELHGNYDSVDQEVRSPLISIHAGDFRVERCSFYDSSKDGVEINPLEGSDDIIGGIVRDIKAYRIGRDAVSISGGKKFATFSSKTFVSKRATDAVP